MFLPPVRKPTGGVAVLLQAASILRQAGYPVRVVPREARGAAFYDAADLPVVNWDDARPGSRDIWLVPEGWVNALAPGLNAGARCVVYVQNWAYLFSALPPDVIWSQLPVSFLAVSHPVALFIEQSLSVWPAILRPGIDLSRFYSMSRKREGRVRVAYMPRKNKALADQIRAIVRARGQCDDIYWDPLEGLDQDGVADRLRAADIFLATGFPEGCPLPPLEAMACGCLPVGFTGFGGWDYMRQAEPEAPGAAKPWHPLRREEEISWSGNGLWAADGDVLAAALCLERAVQWARRDLPQFSNAVSQGQATAAAYSTEHQATAVRAIWDAAARNKLFPTV